MGLHLYYHSSKCMSDRCTLYPIWTSSLQLPVHWFAMTDGQSTCEGRKLPSYRTVCASVINVRVVTMPTQCVVRSLWGPTLRIEQCCCGITPFHFVDTNGNLGQTATGSVLHLDYRTTSKSISSTTLSLSLECVWDSLLTFSHGLCTKRQKLFSQLSSHSNQNTSRLQML